MPNVIAAMAAGYRPCLLCRPDRLPDLGLGDTSPQVAHALRLIVEGALDHTSGAELATRVGYSQRQLTRLFEAELGASPDFIARACRAHLARRLLDESDLSITKIAFTAGFSSIRQMNRVMRELFGFAPSALRAKRRRGDALDPLDGGLHLRIPYDEPFDARRTIAYLASRAIPGVSEVEDGTYRRTINACGYPGVAEVCDGDGSFLRVTLHLASFGSILEQVQRARSLFGITRHDAAAYPALRRDEIIGPLVRRRPGLRLPGAWDRFETSIRILVGQQISVAGASTVCGRLVKRFGQRIEIPLRGSIHSLFPTATALSQAAPEDLDMPRARGRAIIGFARAVASGQLDLYRADPLPQTLAALEALPGIGPWTANLIAARVFDQPDAFAASDLGLRKAVTQRLQLPERISTSRLDRLSQDWSPWRSTAIAYLWMSEDLS